MDGSTRILEAPERPRPTGDRAPAPPPAEAAPPAAAPTPSAPPPPADPVGEIKTAYVAAPAAPTQAGPKGIRFDFNMGARLVIPTRKEGAWQVVLRDLDTGNIIFQTKTQGGYIASSKRYYVRFRLEVFDGDELVFEHDHDARDRNVLIQFPVGTLGDTLAWFPYAARFQETHGCKLTCALSGLIIPILKDQYPAIQFVTHEELADQNLMEMSYATYYMGLFFDDEQNIWQPTDFRLVGLHRTAAYILGVDLAEVRPRVAVSEPGRPIAEPYVCIAVQSSSGCKMWNNPTGWLEVVAHLKRRGYRVICIDQKPVYGSGLLYTHIPHGAEDETGDRPLAERARWLKHADAFVGLSSGLAWLAWATEVPAVLVSGFTHPTTEFTTPYRVINWHTCNSCWNDPKLRFKHDDFLWCPRHQNTARHFECTKLITGHHVIAEIDRALAERGSPPSVTASVSVAHA